MSAIFFLIGCSVLVALIFLGAFIWANKTGQHDDTHTPAMRILFDDHPGPVRDHDQGCDAPDPKNESDVE